MALKRKQDPEDIYHVRGRSRASEGEPETGFRHSTRYHDFFSGYTERTVELPNGKKRIERVYTDPWIAPEAGETETRMMKALYWGLSLASVALYVFALTADTLSNRALYVAAPGLLSVVALILFASALVLYSIRGRRMTNYEYRSGRQSLLRRGIVASTLIALTGAGSLICFLLHTEDTGSLKSGLTLFLSAGLILAVILLERNMKYRQIPNDTAMPEDGFSIN